jgi:uncharacterized membrane protein
MDKKVTSILAYIGLIGWLIAYLAGDKEGAKFHLNQGLVLWIAGIICGIIPCIGWICAIVVLVLIIMGIISAAKDEEKPLPIIGGIKILK